MTVLCPNCGSNNNDSAAYCTTCGSPLSGNSGGGYYNEAYGENTGGGYGADWMNNGYYPPYPPRRRGLPTAAWIGMALAVIVLCLGALYLFVWRPASSAPGGTGVSPTAAPPVTAVPTAPSSVQPTATAAASVPTAPLTVPTAAPNGPNTADLAGHPKVEEPRAGAWLPDYGKVRYVEASGGVSIYLIPEPRSSKHFDEVADDVQVTVLAEQDGYSLVRTADGRVGWVTGKFLVKDSERISRIPDLDNTYWTYYDGSVFYDCKIVGKTLYGYNTDTGEPVEEKVLTQGRRLKIFGVHFVWNGSGFTGSSGKKLYTDTECMYDFTCVSPDDEDYLDWAAHEWDTVAWMEIVEFGTTADGEEYIWVRDPDSDSYDTEVIYYTIWDPYIVIDRYAYTETYRHEDMLYNTYFTLQPLIDLYGLPLIVDLEIDDWGNVRSIEKGYIGTLR